MPITVRGTNPPPYVVTTCQGAEDTTQTWPFLALEDAERAYRAACASGQYALTLSTRRGDLALTLVSLWRRETGQTVRGEPSVSYVEITPRWGQDPSPG